MVNQSTCFTIHIPVKEKEGGKTISLAPFVGGSLNWDTWFTSPKRRQLHAMSFWKVQVI